MKTSFGSCMCDYADKTAGDTSTASVGLENDVMKADIPDIQKVEEGKQRVSSLMTAPDDEQR